MTPGREIVGVVGDVYDKFNSLPPYPDAAHLFAPKAALALAATLTACYRSHGQGPTSFSVC